MDALTHAAVGYAVGGYVGALAAVAPDLAMMRRAPAPPTLYRASHSILVTACLALVSTPAALGHASHLLLDAPTHRGPFGLMPLWPLPVQVQGVGEWEFFNRAWLTGFALAALVIACAAL